MLRAGARNPDAEEEASTSRAHNAHSHAHAHAHAHDMAQLHATLTEYLLLETKSQPRLCLPAESENGEVTIGARDGAAHVLRCLKVWYDLPAEVLISAINLFDRFLTKMKVRPCHVPCITVSCMNLAIEQHCHQHKQPRHVAVEELVSISQSACTAGDVARMSRVIADKLDVTPGSTCLTALHWLKLMRDTLTGAAAHAQLRLPHTDIAPESELVNLLEIAVCDAVCANARMSELALVLLYYKLEQQMVEWSNGGSNSEDAYYLFDIGAQLQQLCRMSDASLMSCASRLRVVVARYEARAAAPHRQRLVWRLSSRTLKVLRPTDRLGSLLPTIEEQHHHQPDATPPPRNRSGSESSEGEDTIDWPRSPVLPVYCD